MIDISDKLFKAEVFVTEDRCLACWQKIDHADTNHKCPDMTFSKEAMVLSNAKDSGLEGNKWLIT